ncbi:50S ribosomal protein L22 [Metamycoplasma hyosynoviae]|nr:50S ribosomal protein L22 [Metamycoplasma hyosynoviae]KDE41973.1 50S ribosomal protein L22 [Metamycoplasma hyosynoviae]KDE43334.1 50S ribosomal protein L22 [Metamycoplasma hyosynoviae]KDE43811.1 50S ribosomal protein L22 [Metamycoplasma hyosynoviae]KDE45155.1 50S ribosomal protein L22 [Metamycoplasma hyosynoviae]
MKLAQQVQKSATASVKMQRISPRKARLVADLIRYRTTIDAINILRTTNKKASSILLKLLNSAIANATNNVGLDATRLFISEVLVNDGPTLKRYQPHSQGRAFSILKRTSNFYIKLSELATQAEFDKMVKEEETSNQKPKAKQVSKTTATKTEPSKPAAKKQATNKKATDEKKTEIKASPAKKPTTVKKASETKPKAAIKSEAKPKTTKSTTEKSTKEKGGK